MVAEEFKIDEKELAILYRHEPILSGEVKIEFFNYDCREYGVDKKLKDMNTKLKHGAIVFVECQKKGTGFEELNWHKAISAENTLLVIRVNMDAVW